MLDTTVARVSERPIQHASGDKVTTDMTKLQFVARIAADRAKIGQLGMAIQIVDTPLRTRQIVFCRQRGYDDRAFFVNTSP